MARSSIILIKSQGAQAKSSDTEKPAKTATMTPMIRQYLEIKADYSDCLLFYHMGDFYELFFDDAIIAAKALGIALTKRGQHQGEDIPMCGVPIRAADPYLQKLIKQGHRVAVCEQSEDPAVAKAKNPKAIVRRAVTRLITAGTITEDVLLAPNESNYLLAVSFTKASGVGVAWVDISTGEFILGSCAMDDLAGFIAQINPKEIIMPLKLLDDPEYKNLWNDDRAMITPLADAFFDSLSAKTRLCEYFAVKTLQGYGSFNRSEIAAGGAILSYIEKTQMTSQPKLIPPKKSLAQNHMVIDLATRTNLELTKGQNGEFKSSLLGAISYTLSPQGSRKLHARISAPLTNPEEITDRLNSVELFYQNHDLRRNCRKILRQMPDITRPLARIALKRAVPRDLGVLRDALGLIPKIILLLTGEQLKSEMAAVHQALRAIPPELEQQFNLCLVDELPVNLTDGGIVREDFNANLDQARTLRDQAHRHLAQLQAQYISETGIKSLKIKQNNVIGTFIEVGVNHEQKIINSSLANKFSHRQTTANFVRFTSDRLAELEQRIASAAQQAQEIETDCFNRLCQLALNHYARLSSAADGLADLDVSAGLGELAVSQDYVRPQVDTSLRFEIEDGRHPVVERVLQSTSLVKFIPNSCDLTAPKQDLAGQLWIVTGPNMGGKSTFLRQNAVITILAQMGAFVPAKSAHIGVVDQLFSRVGASDDLVKGHSTFMAEMVETAAIINQAKNRSLVILDEIGRGTATFDGLSIAWATIEHLYSNNQCRCLFATHFHELTALSSKFKRLRNVTLQVKEWQGEVIFLHKIIPGVANASYGIQVARLAGLPQQIITRADTILEQLEKNRPQLSSEVLLSDLPLFANAGNQPLEKLEKKESAANQQVADDRTGEQEQLQRQIAEQIAKTNPDQLSPFQALELIYSLKKLLLTKLNL